jgi:hypothetical protein
MSKSAAAAESITTEVNIFDSAIDACSIFWIRIDPDSTNYLLVNIPGLHRPGEYVPVYDEIQFVIKDDGIHTVSVKSSDGAAILIDYGVIARG